MPDLKQFAFDVTYLPTGSVNPVTSTRHVKAESPEQAATKRDTILKGLGKIGAVQNVTDIRIESTPEPQPDDIELPVNMAYIPGKSTNPVEIWLNRHRYFVTAAATAIVTAFFCFTLFTPSYGWHFFRETKQYAQKGEKIDLNTASLKELQRLPGIGPVFAQKIVQHRPYNSAWDVLHKIPGFGREKWMGIRDNIAPLSAENKAPTVPTK